MKFELKMERGRILSEKRQESEVKSKRLKRGKWNYRVAGKLITSDGTLKFFAGMLQQSIIKVLAN